jgi:hypothetical protein
LLPFLSIFVFHLKENVFLDKHCRNEEKRAVRIRKMKEMKKRRGREGRTKKRIERNEVYH